MNLKKIRDLQIAKNKIDFIVDINEELNCHKWMEYIMQHSDYFIWDEDTEEGKQTLANIDKVPENFRKKILGGLNKKGYYAEYNDKKKRYNIHISFFSEYNRIGIGFERQLTINDLRRFLDMANYLDALLLNNGTEIIDECTIVSLENKKSISMSREELIELGYKIKTCKDIEELAVMIDLFNENVPHPNGARLFNYPENYEKHRGRYLTYNPTVEEVVDKALSYNEGEELQ
jgi:hypothetical protein